MGGLESYDPATLMQELSVMIGKMMIEGLLTTLATAFSYLCLWFIYRKMGEGGWKCLIPFYGEYVLFKRVWEVGQFWKMIGLTIGVFVCAIFAVIIPFLAIIFLVAIIIFCVALVIIEIKLQVRLAEAFDKGKGFAVGLIFLPIIFVPILAFGKCQYQGEYVE